MDERKLRKTIMPLPDNGRRFSGIAPRGSAVSDPLVEKPQVSEGERPTLDLDLSEFIQSFSESEVPTRKNRYIESLGDLRARLERAMAFSTSEQFDPKEFGARIILIGKITHERDTPNMYYPMEDRLGTHYRLYINPEGRFEDCLDHDRRVVLELDGDLGYIFPIHFKNDPRAE